MLGVVFGGRKEGVKKDLWTLRDHLSYLVLLNCVESA